MGQREDALAVAIPQFGKMFGNIGMGLAGDNPGLRQMAGSVVGTGDEMSRNIENAIMQREAEAEAKKQKRAGMFGKLGSIGGALLAIPTGGTSLLASAAAGAAGSALGGAAGQMLGGGKVDAGNLVNYGISGGLGGGMTNMLGGLIGPTGSLTDSPAAEFSPVLQGLSKVTPTQMKFMGALGGGGLGGFGGPGLGRRMTPMEELAYRYGG